MGEEQWVRKGEGQIFGRGKGKRDGGGGAVGGERGGGRCLRRTGAGVGRGKQGLRRERGRV